MFIYFNTIIVIVSVIIYPSNIWILEKVCIIIMMIMMFVIIIIITMNINHISTRLGAAQRHPTCGKLTSHM